VRLLRGWIVMIVLLQGYNVVIAASWPYLLGVFTLLINGFLFFIHLLMGESLDTDAVE